MSVTQHIIYSTNSHGLILSASEKHGRESVLKKLGSFGFSLFSGEYMYYLQVMNIFFYTE